jgi:hypothetical protein
VRGLREPVTGAVLEDPPLRISWSRIRQYRECKAKAGLLAAGRKSPVADARNWFPGTVADRAMDDWLSLDVPRPGWMAAHVDEILDREEVVRRETGDGVVRWRDRGDKERVRDWCRECVTRLEPILFDLIIPYSYEPHARFTVPFTIPGPDGVPRQILLTGETDLRTWRSEKVPWSVDDLKATEDASYWRKVTGQLVFYEIATWGMTGRWPEVSRLLQPMCAEPVLEFRFTADHRREMFVTICDVASDFWRKNLPPKASSAGCDRCEVRQACPKYAHGRGRVPLAG